MKEWQMREEKRIVTRCAQAAQYLVVLKYLVRSLEGWLLHYESEEAQWAVETAIQFSGGAQWVETHSHLLQSRPQLILHGASARQLEIAENELTVEVTLGDQTVYVDYHTARGLLANLGSN